MHDHAYQDKEFQWNEFGSGAGLALYDFHARMYDPATATWSVPDPAAQFSNPYLAMGNNPVIGVDPDGRFVVGTIIGMYSGGALANGSFDPTTWDYSASSTYIGMGVGGLVGGLGGFAAAGIKSQGSVILGKTISAKVAKNIFT